MQKNANNSIFQILLILCLSLSLLLAQTNRLHMHLEHDDHADTAGHAVDGHVVDVHAASILHDFDPLHHSGHHDGFLADDHHPVAIDVSPDNLIQKTNLLNPLIFILLFIGLLLILPRLFYRIRQRPYIKRSTSRYYLFQPPLRAPPLI